MFNYDSILDFAQDLWHQYEREKKSFKLQTVIIDRHQPQLVPLRLGVSSGQGHRLALIISGTAARYDLRSTNHVLYPYFSLDPPNYCMERLSTLFIQRAKYPPPIEWLYDSSLTQKSRYSQNSSKHMPTPCLLISLDSQPSQSQ